MEIQNSEKTQDLLQSQAHIWSHLFNFIDSISLRCAIQLQIPDIINSHGRPVTISELTKSLPIHISKSQSLQRLMNVLVHSGFFIQHDVPKHDNDQECEAAYVLAPASRLLLSDEPLSLKPYLKIVLDPVLINASFSVSEWFQNEVPTPFETTHGMGLWEYMSREPRLSQVFNEAMASDTRLIMKVVIEDYRGVFEGLRSIVDVGGGNGAAAKVIANEFPDLDCIVLDVPHVVAGLEGSKNLRYVGGNMLEGIPKANAVLLKWILHCSNDEECVKILKRSKEAIPSKENKGKVIIIEIVIGNKTGDDEFMKTQFFYDMQMMIVMPGKQRTESNWKKLFFDAGFSDYKIIPILGLRSIIEVYP